MRGALSASTLFAALTIATVGATSCGIFADSDPRPQRCAACHMEDFRAATNPVHVGTRPAACGICHTQKSWRPSVLAHSPFPLNGAHAKAECFDCHKGTPPKLAGTPRLCVGCHHDDFERAPGHVDQKFSTKCEACHKTTTWTDLVENPAEPTAAPVQTGKPRKPQGKPKPGGSARPKASD